MLKLLLSSPLLSSPQEVSKQYLNSLGLKTDVVKQLQLDQLHVNGTPTLIMVNSQGVIQHAWVGQLPRQSQIEIIKLMTR